MSHLILILALFCAACSDLGPKKPIKPEPVAVAEAANSADSDLRQLRQLDDVTRFDCETNTDCINSCSYGAVSAEWLLRPAPSRSARMNATIKSLQLPAAKMVVVWRMLWTHKIHRRNLLVLVVLVLLSTADSRTRLTTLGGSCSTLFISQRRRPTRQARRTMTLGFTTDASPYRTGSRGAIA